MLTEVVNGGNFSIQTNQVTLTRQVTRRHT